jgi:hypothetical protein
MRKNRSTRNLKSPSAVRKPTRPERSRLLFQQTKGPNMNMHVGKKTLADTTSLVDPTFAAITRHRATNDALSEFIHMKSEFDDGHRDGTGKFKEIPECAEWDQKEEMFGDAEKSAADDLAATVPTTLEGLFAKLDYVSAEHARGNRIYTDDDLVTVIQTAVDSGLLPGKKAKQPRLHAVEKPDLLHLSIAAIPLACKDDAELLDLVDLYMKGSLERDRMAEIEEGLEFGTEARQKYSAKQGRLYKNTGALRVLIANTNAKSLAGIFAKLTVVCQCLGLSGIEDEMVDDLNRNWAYGETVAFSTLRDMVLLAPAVDMSGETKR